MTTKRTPGFAPEDVHLQKIYTVGGQRLQGDIRLSGSKNATLAILAASLLPDVGQTILSNVPRISDVVNMLELIQHLGVRAEFIEQNTVLIDSTQITANEAPYEIIKKMRAGFSVLGPILARYGKARVALPGGCDIGARPVDYHVKGLERLGASITTEYGYVNAVAANGLKGADIYLDFPSVGSTTHLMTAAVKARGITTLRNAAEEPDVVATAEILNAMGAMIRGAGTKEIVIEGVESLHGCEFAIDADRIEAGTFAVAAAITGGDIYIRGAIEEHVQPVTRKLVDVGMDIRFDDDGVRVRLPQGRALSATMVKASPHPGFPTDMQPPFAALLTLAAGTSVITETVYERRFKYIDELARMGADIKTEANAAIIVGVPRLTGAQVSGSDLRASAALILAGLAADGQTEVSGLEYLDRGYEDFVGKLYGVGANIWRADESTVGKASECSV